MTPQLLNILIGIIMLAIGWGIGFADSNLRAKKKIEAAETNAQIAIADAEKKSAAANQLLAQPPQIISQDDPGLLRLKTNFALEMDGAEIGGALTADKKKRLIELLTIIRPYLEGAAPPLASAQPAAPRNPAPVMPVAIAPTSAPVMQAPISAPVDAAKPVIKVDDKKAMASLSMVAQIDTVLQTRLLNTPLAKKGIRVYESPEGGVNVEVGLEKFETIDDVTDPEVKAAIRAAIADWEKKFTPGM